jgi:hypothetical protein
MPQNSKGLAANASLPCVPTDCNSVVAERHHRIDARSSSRRQITGDQRRQLPAQESCLQRLLDRSERYRTATQQSLWQPQLKPRCLPLMPIKANRMVLPVRPSAPARQLRQAPCECRSPACAGSPSRRSRHRCPGRRESRRRQRRKQQAGRRSAAEKRHDRRWSEWCETLRQVDFGFNWRSLVITLPARASGGSLLRTTSSAPTGPSCMARNTPASLASLRHLLHAHRRLRR